MTDRTKLALHQWKCEPHHISPTGPRPVTLNTGDIAVIYLHSKLLVVAVLLAAPAALQAADEAEEDDGSRRCINTRTLRTTDVLDDTHIVFRMVGSKIYLNTLKTNCRGLSRERRFSYTSYSNSLCESDGIRILRDSGIGVHEGRRCRLGRFRLTTEEDIAYMFDITRNLPAPEALEPPPLEDVVSDGKEDEDPG